MEGVLQLLTGAGGEMVVRAQADKPIKGELYFGFLLVMNFESKELIENVFGSEDYKAFIPHREKSFKEINILIADAM